MLRSLFLAMTALTALVGCSEPPEQTAPQKTIGEIAVWDKQLDSVLKRDTPIEVLADGFQWSEGPAWDPARQTIYFSDVPQNKAYQWSEKDGLQTFLDPSGIPADAAAGFREPGSNGLLMHPDGHLLVANHGKRALETLNLETKRRTPIIGTYEGRALNSPNDIALAKDGTLYFTDPSYGLEGLDASPLKDLPHNGVYAFSVDGQISLIDSTQTFPNGIGLSPDERTLYVAVSDPDDPKIVTYTKGADGVFSGPQLWFDAKPYQDKGWAGLPDGMVVADNGHVFATGPGGVFVLSPDGQALGQIQTERATGNCTFGDDGLSLYITAGDTLARVKLLQGKPL